MSKSRGLSFAIIFAAALVESGCKLASVSPTQVNPGSVDNLDVALTSATSAQVFETLSDPPQATISKILTVDSAAPVVVSGTPVRTNPTSLMTTASTVGIPDHGLAASGKAGEVGDAKMLSVAVQSKANLTGWTCQLLGEQIVGGTCDAKGFDLLASNLKASGDVKIQLSDSAGKSKAESKTLHVDKYVIEQISNTAGSATTDFVENSEIVPYGDYLYFMARGTGLPMNLYYTDGKSVMQLTSSPSGDFVADGFYNHRDLIATKFGVIAHLGQTQSVAAVDAASAKFKLLMSYSAGAPNDMSDTWLRSNARYDEQWAYFVANPGRVYRTDGRNVEWLVDQPALGGFSFASEVFGGGKFLLRTGTKLYVYTGAALKVLSDSSAGSGSVVVGDKVVFSAKQLFVTDGTIVKALPRINPAQDLDTILLPQSCGSYAYFVSQNATANHFKLYRTDGAGVTQVSNLRSANANDIIGDFNPEQSRICKGDWYYFTGASDDYPLRIYRTNGSKIEMVSDLDLPNTEQRFFEFINDDLYFVAKRKTDKKLKLFRVNEMGTAQVSDINPGDDDFKTSAGNFRLLNFKNDLYFNAQVNGKSKLFRLHKL